METQEQYATNFRVENDSQATWAIKKYRERVLKMRENERIAKEQLDAVADWLKDVNESLAREASYFEGLLTDYQRRERENRKSIKLPWGTIRSRQSSRVEVDDEFIEWALQEGRDDLLSYAAPKPNIAAIKEAGELPYVNVVESVSFSVEVKE